MSKYVKSPLNYTGGKYKILGDIFPEFIADARYFVDLFAGGFNVGINADAERIFCNDQIPYIIEMFKYFRDTEDDALFNAIYGRIGEFELSDENEDGFKRLRDAYNRAPNTLDLFILTCFSFNHQIRFNSRHEFNTPFGRNRSAYNDSIERNLRGFTSALKNKNIEFSTGDFTAFDFAGLDERDMVYCDPPYLISTGSYNDGKRGFKDWTEKEEKQLLSLLDGLNDGGVNFALSNVFYHKGASNDILIDWSKKYTVTYIDKTYSNCSYHFADRNAKTVEVLVTNYPRKGEKWQQLAI